MNNRVNESVPQRVVTRRDVLRMALILLASMVLILLMRVSTVSVHVHNLIRQPDHLRELLHRDPAVAQQVLDRARIGVMFRLLETPSDFRSNLRS